MTLNQPEHVQGSGIGESRTDSRERAWRQAPADGSL